jgi:hypothetical protein
MRSDSMMAVAMNMISHALWRWLSIKPDKKMCINEDGIASRFKHIERLLLLSNYGA